MSTTAPDPTARVLRGRYRLGAPIGSGSSATVYEAEDLDLQRTVAVKVLHGTLALDPAFLKRFRAEAQLAAGLAHPHIVTVHDWGDDDGVPFLVMEHLGGGSLRAMLERGRRLSPSQALMVGLEACKALDFAHRRGLVHRDIKPANLLFGTDGRLRIADFGLARAIAEAAWTEPSGVVLGTARYASPEQAKGEPVDGRSDVYSLALTLVEAVTGEVPFGGDTAVATLMNRIDKLLPVTADLGPLAPVLERAGRPDPDDRSSAAALGRALVAAAEKLPRPAPLPLVLTGPWLRTAEHRFETGPLPVVPPPPGTADPAATTVAAGPGLDPTVALPVVTPPTPPGAAADPTGPAGGPTTPTSGPLAPPDPAQAPVPPPPRPAPLVDPVLLPPQPVLFDDEAVSGRRRSGKVAALVVVALLVLGGLGAGAFVLWPRATPTHPVPDLVGLDEARAANQVAPFKWRVEVLEQKNDDVAAGTIFRTEPALGALAEGGTLVLYVSSGPTLSPLPDVRLKPLAEATAAVEAQRLVPKVIGESFDETVPAGAVLSYAVAGQALAPGTPLVKGTVVELAVSKGPQPRKVPALAGKSFEEATAALAAIQLRIERAEDVFSDRYASGAVAVVDPAAGTEVPRDAVVRVAVSKGQDLVVVPNVYGATLELAARQINEAGLSFAAEGPTDKRVLEVTPPPGTALKRGSQVKLKFA
jgi:beta-lactam-binding protein with PASTA domain